MEKVDKTDSHFPVEGSSMSLSNEENTPSVSIPSPLPNAPDMNTDELIGKFSKYETDYTQRLMAKYFSDKDIFGGNVFEQSTKIDGETIKASRWHCAQSYADPVQYFKEKSVSPVISSADAQANVSNGKSSVDKDG